MARVYSWKTETKYGPFETSYRKASPHDRVITVRSSGGCLNELSVAQAYDIARDILDAVKAANEDPPIKPQSQIDR